MKKTLLVLVTLWMPLAATSTYYNYSRTELCELKGAKAEGCISEQQLQEWDKKAADTMGDMPYFKRLRVYTYLYVAQEEVAGLARRVKGQMVGDIGPVSNAVLKALLPDYSESEAAGDEFSQKAAALVMEKLAPRIKCEEESEAEWAKGEHPEYTVARYTCKWCPWHLKNPIAYYPPPPSTGDAAWKEEVRQIKQIQEPLTDEKKKAIRFWAGVDSIEEGDWRIIANNFMFSNHVSLSKIITVRSTLLRGVYDAAIVCFGSKYRYMLDRPKITDDSVHYEIEVPQHPSYPSGHSTESTTAALILSHYFPNCKRYFCCLANEAAYSRIWAGIHYPADDRAGRYSGRKVAGTVLRK